MLPEFIKSSSSSSSPQQQQHHPQIICAGNQNRNWLCSDRAAILYLPSESPNGNWFSRFDRENITGRHLIDRGKGHRQMYLYDCYCYCLHIDKRALNRVPAELFHSHSILWFLINWIWYRSERVLALSPFRYSFHSKIAYFPFRRARLFRISGKHLAPWHSVP